MRVELRLIPPPPTNGMEWNGMGLLGLTASLLAGGQLVKPENPGSGADSRLIQM